ncbi:MAG: 6-carboxytetrahydropterin synthase QueD [Proteobacteria bacterium]|nr:6-carboxytetrahydropterin synthase QueD [Pseudomonadota bacterium]
MRCQLVREYRFEAAHRLPRVPPQHKCSRVHGHSYRVTVVLEGEVDAETGWLVDFADIDTQVDPVIGRLDHRFLNEIQGLGNPTCEMLASWLWREIKPGLPLLIELAVSETENSRCIYRGE